MREVVSKCPINADILNRWAEQVGVDKRTIRYRIMAGWPLERVLSTPGPLRLTFNGRTQSVAQWAKEVGIDERTLRRRINDYEWSTTKALTHRVKRIPV